MADKDKEIAELKAKVKLLREGFKKMLAFTDAQAKDEGLWVMPEQISEDYIQRGLRGCHAFVESVAKQALAETKGVNNV